MHLYMGACTYNTHLCDIYFDQSNNESVDPACQGYYSTETCEGFYSLQKINYTLLDAMTNLGYNVHLYGKVDVGAGIIEMSSQSNATVNGFHGGPNIITFTRSANIERPTKNVPIANENDNNVHNGDWKIAQKCVERIYLL